MKALTLHQPWATLVAIGAKSIETRSWTTTYRGPLAIHAAARPLGNGALAVGPWTNVTGEPIAEGQEAMLGPDRQLLVCPLGAVVATCRLVDVVPVEDVTWTTGGRPSESWWHIGQTSPTRHLYAAHDTERPFGDFSLSRFAWLLADVVPLDPPVMARGRQRLWEWTS